MQAVLIFLVAVYWLGGGWLVLAVIYCIAFTMVPPVGKIIMAIIVIVAFIMSEIDGEYEPGKGEWLETLEQIKAREKELKSKGYSPRKINEDAQLDKLKRKAIRLYEKYGDKSWL